MVAPMISSLAAYMLVTGQIIPWWHMVVWMCVISIIGVLLAFPMKRRFINEEQLPFPEGRASGVVLDALYTGAAQGRHVQGAAARLHCARRRRLPIHHQRRLDEASAVQDPALGSMGGPEGAVDVPRAARLLLLRGRRQSESARYRRSSAPISASSGCA